MIVNRFRFHSRGPVVLGHWPWLLAGEVTAEEIEIDTDPAPLTEDDDE